MADYQSIYSGTEIDNGVKRALGLPSSGSSGDPGKFLKYTSVSGTTPSYSFDFPANILYTTTVPTTANTDGIKIAVLSSEPQIKYNGWLYIITG